jgi:hypothetical protein
MAARMDVKRHGASFYAVFYYGGNAAARVL